MRGSQTSPSRPSWSNRVTTAQVLKHVNAPYNAPKFVGGFKKMDFRREWFDTLSVVEKVVRQFHPPAQAHLVDDWNFSRRIFVEIAARDCELLGLARRVRAELLRLNRDYEVLIRYFRRKWLAQAALASRPGVTLLTPTQEQREIFQVERHQ